MAETPCVCKVYQKVFICKHHLHRHQTEEICNKSFSVQKVEDETKSRKSPLKCNFCGKKFEYLCKLQKHRRIHTEEQPFKCNICQRGFSRKYNLKRHQLLHKRERSSENVVGQKASLLKSYLMSYQPSNTFKKSSTEQEIPEKNRWSDGKSLPFKCNYGEKEFKHFYKFEQHWRTRLIERPYKCGSCLKKFTRISHVIRHQKSHKMELPFQCHICQEYFIYEDYLKRHLENHEMEKSRKSGKGIRTLDRLKNYMQLKKKENLCTLEGLKEHSKASTIMVQNHKNDSVKSHNETNLEGTSVVYFENNNFKSTCQQDSSVNNSFGNFSNQNQPNLVDHSSNTIQNELQIQTEENPPISKDCNTSVNESTSILKQMLTNTSTEKLNNKNSSEIHTELNLQGKWNSTAEKN